MLKKITPVPKTIIFDFDGTIVDSFDEVLAIYNRICSFYGCVNVQNEEIEFLRKQSYSFILKEKKLYPWKVPFILIHAKRMLRKKMFEIQLIDGIKEVLFQLKNEGYLLGILTSNNTKSVQNYLNMNNINVFEFVISERNLFTKEKSLKKILAKYDLLPELTWYVGDENRDIISAHKSGIHSIGLSYGFSGSSISNSKPDYIVTSSYELLELFVDSKQTN